MNALTEEALDIIYRHADRVYPNECCDFVLGLE
jgi:proteasome lid subunit RPN8/RPN11